MPKILTKLLFQQSKSNSGFTLMEVIVASLMVFFFVVGSMQALALSVAIRVKAQERQRADQLIQEDIEAVRLAAENMAANPSLCRATVYAGSYAEALNHDAAFPVGTKTKRLLEDNSNSKEYELRRYIKLPDQNDPDLIDSSHPNYVDFDDLDHTDLSLSTNTVLKIKYEVREKILPPPLDPKDPIATDYIEVIPNAATQCP